MTTNFNGEGSRSMKFRVFRIKWPRGELLGSPYPADSEQFMLIEELC